jgi:hypothetical protein
MCGLALDSFTIRCDEHAGHHSQAAKALSKDIALDIAVVILGRPDEATGRLNNLCHHVVNKSMLVRNSCVQERLFVCSENYIPIGQSFQCKCKENKRFINLLENIFKPTIIFLQDRVLGRQELIDSLASLSRREVRHRRSPKASSFATPS